MKNTIVTLLLLVAVLSASQALATDPPDPSTGEATIAAGSLGVVMVTIGSTSGGNWTDMFSDDGGALQLVTTSINGIPAIPGLFCTQAQGVFGRGVAAPGDRIAVLYFNPTGSPIDVTVTADFDTPGLSCPPY